MPDAGGKVFRSLPAPNNPQRLVRGLGGRIGPRCTRQRSLVPVSEASSRSPRRGEAREAVLAAATRLFARRGYGATPIQAICDEVGISKAALLYHYPSKQALHGAVLDGVLAHWGSALPRLMKAASGGVERFEVVMNEVIEFFTEDTDRARLLMREAMDHERDMSEVVQRYMRPWVELTAEYLRRGQAAGRVRADVDPEAFLVNVAATLIGTLAAGAVSEAMAPSTDPSLPAQRSLAEMIRGYRAALFVDE